MFASEAKTDMRWSSRNFAFAGFNMGTRLPGRDCPCCYLRDTTKR